MAEMQRDKDLVLTPGEFTFIFDRTKGQVSVIVGPHKTSLSDTEMPVVWRHDQRRFITTGTDEARQLFVTATEGHYVVLTNPVIDPEKEAKHPPEATITQGCKLQFGKKIVFPGPAYFPLWPRQHAVVVEGHQLQSNQYLLVRIYSEEQAKLNWKSAVIKPQTAPEQILPEQSEGTKSEQPPKGADATDVPLEQLTMGRLFVVRGTQVQFYIPPSGVEVVKDDHGSYVRNAVTLERLEYCILLDQNGNKRFVQGPAVVFPEPTETFITSDSGGKGDSRKFRAIELNENAGIHVKVIAEYTDNGQQHKVGDELFITGKEQSIYFPRQEHAIIRYGDRERHFATAVPAGEGRYILDRDAGEIKLERGPKMLLPDPRKEVTVKRVLSPAQVELWFPGNMEALDHNAKLAQQAAQEEGAGKQFVRSHAGDEQLIAKSVAASTFGAAEAKYVGEEFDRQTTYTPPRTVTLDTRYDGAVTIEAWTGYAVLVESKRDKRRVEVGPKTILLEYDEKLGSMALSTGKPKTTDVLYKTAYLRVANNLVSDIVSAETKDLCQVKIKCSYRVNFEGDPNRWFNVENYVKFLTDHARSRLRNAVKHYGIEEFYQNAIDIVRDTVLGKAEEGKERPGCAFKENGMRIYDVEVLRVDIDNADIAGLLQQAQHDAVNQTIRIAEAERELDFTRRSEKIKRDTLEENATTAAKDLQLRTEAVGQKLQLNLAEIQAAAETRMSKINVEAVAQSEELAIQQATLTVQHEMDDAKRKQREADDQLELASREARLKLEIQQLMSEAKAVAEKAKAITPDMVAAFQSFADADLAGKLATSMAPMALLGGESVVDALSKLLRGTGIEQVLQQLPSRLGASARGDGSKSANLSR